MSDHKPVLFIVFEDWNKESVISHISFVSFAIKYYIQLTRFEILFVFVFERKRPIRRSLIKIRYQHSITLGRWKTTNRFCAN